MKSVTIQFGASITIDVDAVSEEEAEAKAVEMLLNGTHQIQGLGELEIFEDQVHVIDCNG